MAIEKVSHVKAHQQYRLKDGTLVPGVTTVLSILAKPGLVKWANNLGLQGIDTTKYVDALAQIGTLAHYMIECHFLGVEPDLTAYSPEQIDRAENSLIKFWEWEKEHELKPVFVETPFVSERYKFGGTVDFFGLVDGWETLVDFKTSKALYDEHIHQVAAYKKLLQELGYPVKKVRLLRIGRTEDEGFEELVIPPRQLNVHWKIFGHTLAIYRLKKEAA